MRARKVVLGLCVVSSAFFTVIPAVLARELVVYVIASEHSFLAESLPFQGEDSMIVDDLAKAPRHSKLVSCIKGFPNTRVVIVSRYGGEANANPCSFGVRSSLIVFSEKLNANYSYDKLKPDRRVGAVRDQICVRPKDSERVVSLLSPVTKFDYGTQGKAVALLKSIEDPGLKSQADRVYEACLK